VPYNTEYESYQTNGISAYWPFLIAAFGIPLKSISTDFSEIKLLEQIYFEMKWNYGIIGTHLM
jgi:hypothetical protein